MIYSFLRENWDFLHTKRVMQAVKMPDVIQYTFIYSFIYISHNEILCDIDLEKYNWA